MSPTDSIPATTQRRHSEWLTQKQAADEAKCSERTVRNWIATGRLPAYRPKGSRLIRISRDDLDALMVRVPTTGGE